MLAVLALTAAAWAFWPAGDPGPLVLIDRAQVGGSRWAVLAQQSGGTACLQVRVNGARRARMCDRHWAESVNLWHGPLPEHQVVPIGPPSLLRVTFPGSDRVLVVSVLPEAITELRLAGPGHRPDTRLTVRRLLGSKENYVLAVVDRAQLGEPKAFDSAGQPIYYRFMDR
ncbi:hypothetical protein DMB66_21775 [Actinoplanes sp. ATCC 53533]|nr:hypothetical protein DMB66_21775 [Actinoplanes sp. ATCC 53533]